jgi:hypothetical protein
MTKMRLRTTMAVALAATAAVLGLLAGPAGAQASGPSTSGGARATTDSVASGTCVATTDSTCSGSGTAALDSTSSGSAVAIDGSVASGCATAQRDATASGAPCPPAAGATTTTTRPGTTTGGGGTTTATAGRALALTGSPTTDLAALAALVLVLGALLVHVGTRRPVRS